MNAQEHPAALEVADLIIEEALDKAQQAASLRRRLRLALHDLQALDIVGPEWGSIGDHSVEFSPLPLAKADRLIQLLEDLTRDTVSEPPTEVTGQMSLPMWNPVTPVVAVAR